MIQSSLLSQFPELVHGFSTAENGPMAAIQLTPEKLENRNRFCESLGIAPSKLVIPHQVHGTDLLWVDETHTAGKHGDRSAFDSADALITDKPDVFLSVFTADCLPVFFYDPAHKRVATAHLGWRGLTNGLLQKTVAALPEIDDMQVWVGPHIGKCHYRLSADSPSYAEKVEAFAKWPTAVIKRDGETFLDLTGVVMGQLADMGVTTSHIEIAADCTACQAETYYSYHKEKGQQAGQMIGVLGIHYDES
jgi:YfiH family protein